MNRTKLILFTLLTLFLFSCEKQELTSPSDNQLSPLVGGLSIIPLTDSSVTLNWHQNNDVQDKFVLERKANSEGEFSTIAELGANENSFTDMELLTSNTYYYKLTGHSGEQTTNTITDSISTSFSSIFYFATRQVNLNSSELTWAHNCNYESGYRLERMEVSDIRQNRSQTDNLLRKSNVSESNVSESYVSESYDREFEIIAELPPNTIQYLDETVLPYCSYSYRLKAFSNVNESEYIEESCEISFPAPTSLVIYQSALTTCELSWEDKSIGEQGFKIDRKEADAEWEIAYQTLIENVETFSDTGLTPSSNYQYRIYGFYEENSSTSISEEINLISLPTPTNLQITLTSIVSCQLSWDYSPVGGEYGLMLKRKISDGSWTELSQLEIDQTDYEDTNLSGDATYEYMIYAFRDEYEGEMISETIDIPASTLTDFDGNVYQLILIDNKIWMEENLKVTHYRNGNDIPLLTDIGDWINTTNGAYCVYNNYSEPQGNNGNLYNWFAVNDSRNIAPEGWHIPSDAELQELEIALGMNPSVVNYTDLRGTNEGSKLAGSAYSWNSGELENDSEFNSTGFNFLPAGIRDHDDGSFYRRGNRGLFWTTTQANNIEAWYRGIDHDDTRICRYEAEKNYGFSVRCVKD